MLPVYKIWHTLLSTRILLSKLLLSFLKRTYVSRNALNLNLLNYNMKILQVAFLLLFNYKDLSFMHVHKTVRKTSCSMLSSNDGHMVTGKIVAYLQDISCILLREMQYLNTAFLKGNYKQIKFG